VTVVREARLLPNSGDIVVEFGNARYQDRMDRRNTLLAAKRHAAAATAKSFTDDDRKALFGLLEQQAHGSPPAGCVHRVRVSLTDERG
jgi:hypothetical protein